MTREEYKKVKFPSFGGAMSRITGRIANLGVPNLREVRCKYTEAVRTTQCVLIFDGIERHESDHRGFHCVLFHHPLGDFLDQQLSRRLFGYFSSFNKLLNGHR